MTHPKKDRLLTPGEVAAHFDVTAGTVRRWAADGRLSGLRTPGGHHRFWESDVLAAVRVERATFVVEELTAEVWNQLYPVGTPVTAYPGGRNGRAVRSRTRTQAWILGHPAPVVAVEGLPRGIALTHVDPIEIRTRR